MISARQLYAELTIFGIMPSGAAGKEWLQNAERDTIKLLTEERELTILYASFRHLWIVCVLAPAMNLRRANKDDLYSARIGADQAWFMQRSWGGGQARRMFLEPPLEFGPDHPLHGAEPVVFRREFVGMSNFDAPIEISQKLVHSLGLHFLEDRNAFCRLNEEGDIEEVIYVFQDQGTGDFDSRACVLINSKILAEYMAVGEYSLFRKFDVTRYHSFSEWDESERHFDAPDIFYNSGKSGDPASYVHGGQVLRPAVTVEELIEQWKSSEDPSARRYETFLIHDWKNKRIVEWSSAPDQLSNYFEESEKPFEISPVYFRPDVLTKYKADPDKYDLRDRSITCRNSWYLKTYDLNDAGQVHTYIRYLQSLPFREQQHWKLYNEAPKGGLSRRAIENDFEGKWSTEEDPLESLRYVIETLDSNPPAWWSPRGSDLVRRVHYPVTTSSKEWADELQVLDQLVVEGFVATELRKIAVAVGVSVDTKWQSLKLIQEFLRARSRVNADEIVEPLRRLHYLRSKVSGHHTKERKTLEKDAFSQNGSLAAHFRALCRQCHEGFTTIIDELHASR
jgi:hypothetical protein